MKLYSLTNHSELTSMLSTDDVQFTCYDLIFDFETVDLIVFGTNKGTLRLFLWPFTPIEKHLPEFIEISVC